MRVVCLYLHQEQNVLPLAEVFYRATPQIMVRGERAIFMEVSKCAGLYSEASFLRRAKVTLARMQIRAQMAVADDIPTALSFAFFKMSNKNLLPIEALRFYADPMGDQPETSTQIQ